MISQLTEIEATRFEPLKISLIAWAITPAVLRAIRGDSAAAQTLIDNLETDVGDKKWWLAVQTLLKRFLFDDGAYRESCSPLYMCVNDWVMRLCRLSCPPTPLFMHFVTQCDCMLRLLFLVVPFCHETDSQNSVHFTSRHTSAALYDHCAIGLAHPLPMH